MSAPRLAGLLLALAAGVAPAQPGPPIDSPACRRALDTLDDREAAAARDRALRGALETARRQAALACLGGRDAPASAAAPRAGQPSVTSVPTGPRPTVAVPRPPPAAVPPPVPRPAPLLTITTCDATGCWTSDGTRLQRVGPNLLGPKGLCTTSGAVVTCPP